MSCNKQRLTLEDTDRSSILKMAGGNPGAINVCMNILTQGAAIDPDNWFGQLGALLVLDTLNIYESRIWILYKHVCGQDLTTMLALLRAAQLGIMSESELIGAIDANTISPLRRKEIVTLVKEQLPNFGHA